MPVFQYKAHDKSSNREVKDTVEATNQSDAIAAIKKQGFLPIEVREVKKSGIFGSGAAELKKKGGGINITIGTGVSTTQICEFTRQLSTLIDAGLPIVQSLQILTDMQKPGPFRNCCAKISDSVQGGNMLSESMAQHPKIFQPLFTNMVKAGETAGALEPILRRLADFLEKAEKLKKKVKGAMIYPAAVSIIATGILTFIMVFIIPKFAAIFKELGLKLPAVTQILIDFSSFVGSYWWLIAAGIFGTVVGLRLFRATKSGGAIVDRLMLKLPVLGNVIKKSAVARFTRTLGTLVTSGVGFLEALDITKAATPNIVVQNAIQAVRDSVKEGESINEPLARSGVFNDIVVNMIKVGE